MSKASTDPVSPTHMINLKDVIAAGDKQVQAAGYYISPQVYSING